MFYTLFLGWKKKIRPNRWWEISFYQTCDSVGSNIHFKYIRKLDDDLKDKRCDRAYDTTNVIWIIGHTDQEEVLKERIWNRIFNINQEKVIWQLKEILPEHIIDKGLSNTQIDNVHTTISSNRPIF